MGADRLVHEHLKAKATQADNEFPAWDAKGILRIIHDHAKPFLLRMLTTAGVSGTGTYMYLGLNGNWIMRSDLAVRFLSIDFAEAAFRDQPGGLGTYDILDKTGKWLVRSLGDVPALGQVQGSGDESNCATCAESHSRLTAPASPPTTILKTPTALIMTPTRTMCPTPLRRSLEDQIGA